ncbi:MAG: carboxypeptidase-like regulatory domain-containing protein [Terracidiphilus sp.]
MGSWWPALWLDSGRIPGRAWRLRIAGWNLSGAASPNAARAQRGDGVEQSATTGLVSDGTGSPIRNATVDVFAGGSQESQPAATMRTDARGRFSADLPDGKYVLEVGVPEIGESSLQVEVSKLVRNPELQIKLAVTPS